MKISILFLLLLPIANSKEEDPSQTYEDLKKEVDSMVKEISEEEESQESYTNTQSQFILSLLRKLRLMMKMTKSHQYHTQTSLKLKSFSLFVDLEQVIQS